MKTRLTVCFLLALSAVGCGDSPSTDESVAVDAGKATVHEIDFTGTRHQLGLQLHPTFQAVIPNDSAAEGVSIDLRVRNEAGQHLAISGNGRRSVMFVGGGGRATFDTVCTCDDHAALRAAFPKSGLYFSPQLRIEEAVVGTVFLAMIQRGEAGSEWLHTARVLIENVGDTTLTLRVSMGPALRTD